MPTGPALDLFDTSGGPGLFTAVSLNGSFAAADLGITAAGVAGKISGSSIVAGSLRLDGRLDDDTLTGGSGEDMLDRWRRRRHGSPAGSAWTRSREARHEPDPHQHAR